MMFSCCFTVFLFITFGVNGQINDINTVRPSHVEKGYPFGKLRLFEEGQHEELISPPEIEIPQLNQGQSFSVQPLPSPCIGTRPLTKLAYPKDKTKYIECRDEYHYEFFTCPNNGLYNEQTGTCDRAISIPIIDKCEQEKPCLNYGYCTLLSNSTFKCTCRQDWTGERCETPLNSCVKKPCGPNGVCRTLKTIDYEQDYICVCHGNKGYGLNCQETVPNPCLQTAEQFFPYAFSQHVYIQCDADLIYFQPCGPLLYWSQENKICDRKRSTKSELPPMFTKLISNNNEKQQAIDKPAMNEEIILTTTVRPEQTQAKEVNEGIFSFVPARIANREQLQPSINTHQGVIMQNPREMERKPQELASALSQPVESSPINQYFMSKPKQWPMLQKYVTG